MTLLVRFIRDDSGSTVVEYGLIAAFVALLLINAASSLGTKINADFKKLSGNL